MWQTTTAGAQVYEGALWTAYVQDAWRVLPNLTLKLGVRYDQVSYDNNIGSQIADLTKFQPRIGGAWDITGDAKNVVRFNWGRFMHPSALTLPDFARAANEPSYRYYSCSTIGNYFWGWGVETAEECEAYALGAGYAAYDPGYDGTDPLGWFLHPAEIYGAEQNEIDSGLKPSYADTLSIGYERQIANRASIEISYVDKKTKDIFEDTCTINLEEGGPQEGPCTGYLVTNLPWPTRDYQGVMLTLETRTLSWLTLIASYTYSESKGNLEYSQGHNPAFDFYPWHFENRYGFLSDHRDHRFKLNGFVLLPYDFTIGFDGWYSSAFTWEPRQDSGGDPDIPYDEYFLEPRGSRDAFNSYRLDLQVTKGFTIANRLRLALIGTVYNTFSTEYGTDVCDIVYGCGEYEMGDATEWATPRRYEIGFRIEF
jgi:outer membrane receptor protein involved in Fe transport